MPNSDKHVVFFSKDFNIGYSFLVYLQNIYNVTVTTDITALKNIVENNNINLLIIDSDPTDQIELLVEDLLNRNAGLRVILTYVYKDQIKEVDNRLRKYVNSIFYKPYDLNEITQSMNALMV